MSSGALTDYLSGLTITQGRRAGERFHVLPWQRRFLRGAFKPGAGVAALSVGRGNGKTALVAGIACAALEGPLVVPRAETVIVASSFSQATIAFEHVIAFLGIARWTGTDIGFGNPASLPGFRIGQRAPWCDALGAIPGARMAWRHR